MQIHVLDHLIFTWHQCVIYKKLSRCFEHGLNIIGYFKYHGLFDTTLYIIRHADTLLELKHVRPRMYVLRL